MAKKIERRKALTILGGMGLGVIAAASRTGAPIAAAAGWPRPDATEPCVLTPEISEGPYYFPVKLVRSDLTEGKSGAPLQVAFKVLDAKTCQPVKGATVDVWSADPTGIYSGYGAVATFQPAGGAGGPMQRDPNGRPAFQGGGGPDGPPHENPINTLTFLRGIQLTDEAGAAGFRSIYPGWYDHRSVHFHVKVHIGDHVVHTGQIFFPDEMTDEVFKSDLYASRGPRLVRNDNDYLFHLGGPRSTFALQPIRAGGYTASLVLAVNRT